MTELERQQLEEKQKNSPYNNEPVYYCKHCLSLLVMTSEEGEEFFKDGYCEHCGSTDIGQTDIFTWQKMYNDKYKNVMLKEQENIYKYGRK